MDMEFSNGKGNGKRNGKYRSFDNQGRILTSGFYKRGQRDSVWENYSVNGKVIERKEWSGLQRVGLWFKSNFKGDTLMFEQLPTVKELSSTPSLNNKKYSFCVEFREVFKNEIDFFFRALETVFFEDKKSSRSL